MPPHTKIATVVAGVLMAGFSVPMVAPLLGVGAQGRLVAEGRQVFLGHCAECHDDDASGGNAMDIRGVSHADVAISLQGVEEMPEILLADHEVDAVAAYLASLTTR